MDKQLLHNCHDRKPREPLQSNQGNRHVYERALSENMLNRQGPRMLPRNPAMKCSVSFHNPRDQLHRAFGEHGGQLPERMHQSSQLSSRRSSRHGRRRAQRQERPNAAGFRRSANAVSFYPWTRPITLISVSARQPQKCS